MKLFACVKKEFPFQVPQEAIYIRERLARTRCRQRKTKTTLVGMRSVSVFLLIYVLAAPTGTLAWIATAASSPPPPPPRSIAKVPKAIPSSVQSNFASPRLPSTLRSASTTESTGATTETETTVMPNHNRDSVRNFRPVLHPDIPLYRCATTDRIADLAPPRTVARACEDYENNSNNNSEKTSRTEDEDTMAETTDAVAVSNDNSRSDTITMEDKADDPGCQCLWNDAGLVIDLRSELERRPTATALAWLEYRRARIQYDSFHLLPHDNDDTRDTNDAPLPPPLYLLRLDPLCREKLLEHLDAHWLTAAERVQCGWYQLVDGNALHDFRMDRINDRGLVGMYQAILETGGPSLATALQAMTVYWEEYIAASKRVATDTVSLQASSSSSSFSSPPPPSIVFHCVHGKDRTGLLAMLCQSILGHSDDQMIDSYHATETFVPPKTYDALPARGTLDRRVFAGAPRPVLTATLAWLRSRDGSVDGYLDRIGFDAGWRRRFVAAVEAVSTVPSWASLQQPQRSKL